MNAVFAGSFNPFTLGHLEIVKQGLMLFDRIIVAVAEDCDKACLPLMDRIFIAKQSLLNLHQQHNDKDDVRVLGFNGLTTDFCKKNDCKFLIRGIRNALDLDYEKSLMEVYKRLSDIQLVYFIAKDAHISSSQVRLLAKYGADLNGYVCDNVKENVIHLYKSVNE